MKTVFFYCDSQANILTSYFMKKMYYDKYFRYIQDNFYKQNKTLKFNN